MLSDKHRKWSKTDNTVPVIRTKILGHKAENAYDIESIQTKILERMTAYWDRENGSGDRKFGGRKRGMEGAREEERNEEKEGRERVGERILFSLLRQVNG